MLAGGLNQFCGKRVLMLQGPLGPFFGNLMTDLQAIGAQVFKVNFNAGDWLYSPSGLNYRGNEVLGAQVAKKNQNNALFCGLIGSYGRDGYSAERSRRAKIVRHQCSAGGTAPFRGSAEHLCTCLYSCRPDQTQSARTPTGALSSANGSDGGGTQRA